MTTLNDLELRNGRCVILPKAVAFGAHSVCNRNSKDSSFWHYMIHDGGRMLIILPNYSKN